MAFFSIKIRQIILLLILFNITSNEFLNKNSLISSPLFSQENFGKIHKVFYQNDKENSNLILLSENSISSVNIPKNEINYRRKINKLSEIVNLEPKNYFLTQRKSNTVEVYRTETGQFVNSLEIISNNDLLYDVKTVKIKDLTMTIFISFKSITIQTKKKIVFEKNFVKEDSNEENKKNKNVNMILDLYIDEENKNIIYVFTVNGKVKINKITFDSLHKTFLSKKKSEEEDNQEEDDNEENEENNKKKKNKKTNEIVEVEQKEIFSQNVEGMIIKGLLTKDFLYIYDGRNIFGYEIVSQKMEMFGLAEQSITLNIWSFYKENGLLLRGRKQFYYFVNGQISFTFDTANHISCSFSNLPTKKLYCYLNVDSSDKNLVSYWPDKDGKLERDFYTIDPLVQIYSDSNTLDKVKLIEVSPYNDKIFTLVTTSKIIEFMINSKNKVELIGEIENNYEKYVLSELFLYNKRDESNNDIFESYIQYQNYCTTINSLKGNINLLKILKNLLKIITDDAIEILKSLRKLFLNISQIINNLINKRVFDLGKESSKRENMAFLFLVTENNLMKILDAYTGKLLHVQQFPRNQRIKIIKDNSIDQRYVSILFGKKNFLVYDLLENKFVNDISSVFNKLNLDDELLINDEQLSVIMKSFLSLIKNKPVYDLRKFNLDEKIFGPNKERIALYVDYEKSILYILKFYINKNNEKKLILLNNFNFENIISIINPKISEDISQHYLSEGKIFYKFINNNIYYILSTEQKDIEKNENESTKKNEKQRLVLTILDGKNGKILSEKVIENLEISSVRYLFEENWGLISYTKNNKGYKRNEILSFEIMNKNVDYDLIRLFKKYFLNDKKSKNLPNNENEIEIIIKTYVIERSIKNLSLSKTKYNKGNKFVLMIFDNNDLQLIKREELSPRRPNMVLIKGKPTFDQESNSIYVDKELPGYTPIVKLDANNRFINKDKIDVYDIKTAQGEDESSFMTCIIGDNVDCKIMYPDKLYDKLSPEFKKELLIAVTLGFVIFIFFFRKYNIKNEFKKVFLAEKF